ncbi:hypothetical protein [Streptomyces sp. NPDC015125]|uniref:hypothetical protein n=1 Tax=Streptomyces sp. NPDC015125 TaxID=3364938 RepID=UPI0036F9B0D9
MNEENLKLRNLADVKEETRNSSDKILKLIDLRGKVTEPGPSIAPCSEYSGDVYRASHPWSLYDVPVAEMKKAMDRLRGNLPKNGWKIVKDGPDKSPAKTPEIIANSKGNEFSVKVRLLAEPAGSKHTSLIAVTVESACFRTNKPD